MLEVQSIRDLLKTRHMLVKAHYPPDHPAVDGLHSIIRDYARRAGMKRYLSEMLGPLVMVRTIVVAWSPGNGEQAVSIEPGLDLQTHLSRQYEVQTLPWLVRWNGDERWL